MNILINVKPERLFFADDPFLINRISQAIWAGCDSILAIEWDRTRGFRECRTMRARLRREAKGESRDGQKKGTRPDAQAAEIAEVRRAEIC